MSEVEAGVQIEWSVAAISVGTRHRQELGDIHTMAASIQRVGLLQPITITPDGSLVCGARRLAAIKFLGWKTVRVWVRSGISDRLGKLLAEQDDNVLHKPLTPIESAALYRELKALLAEDAARRQAATQFSSDRQPGENGSGDSPEPFGPLGDARAQAAQMVTGAESYQRLEQIGYLERIATDPAQPPELRARARQELDRIEDGGPVHPAYIRIRDAVAAVPPEQREDLQRLAQETLDRVKDQKPSKKKTPRRPVLSVDGETVKFPVRAFVLTWTELINWWERYDLHHVATEITDEQADAFYDTVKGTVTFAGELRKARAADTDAS